MHDDYEREIYPEFYTNSYEIGDEPIEKPVLSGLAVRLRSWRGQRGYREVVEILKTDLQTGIVPRELYLLENDKFSNRQELVDMLHSYLPE